MTPTSSAGSGLSGTTLLERSSAATIYQTWEWNKAWWQVFGRRKRAIVLEMRDRGALVAIAPLYVSRHLGTPLRRLALIGTGASDYLDVIAAPGYEDAAASAVTHWVRQSRDHDLADLQQLRSESSLLRASDCLATVEQEPCPYVPLTGGWDAIAHKLGKKMRSNIALLRSTARSHVRGPERRPRHRGGYPVRHGRALRPPPAPMARAFAAGRPRRSRVQAFHREVAARFLQRGWLRLHLMQAGGRVIAALYCFRYRDRYYYYLGGFDPALARHSPGTVLTAHAIRDAIARAAPSLTSSGAPNRINTDGNRRHRSTSDC